MEIKRLYGAKGREVSGCPANAAPPTSLVWPRHVPSLRSPVRPSPGPLSVVRPRGGLPADVTVEIIRPDDLLALCVEGYNLRLDTSDARHPQLVRKTASASARPAIDSTDD
jgi:hypothetical protein